MNQWRKHVFVLIVLSHLSFNGCEAGVDSLDWTGVLANIHEKFPEVRHLSTKDLADWLQDQNQEPPTILDTRETTRVCRESPSKCPIP